MKGTVLPFISSKCLALRRIEGGKEVGHVVGVLLFFCQNPFDHTTARRIVFTEVARHFGIGIDGDAFGNEVFSNHVR
jgi:hypothetical protein